jgi:hypothetical protein
MKAPTKQSQLDPAPTWLLKCLGDVLSPTLALMCNLSFQQCAIPKEKLAEKAFSGPAQSSLIQANFESDICIKAGGESR